MVVSFSSTFKLKKHTLTHTLTEPKIQTGTQTHTFTNSQREQKDKIRMIQIEP